MKTDRYFDAIIKKADRFKNDTTAMLKARMQAKAEVETRHADIVNEKRPGYIARDMEVVDRTARNKEAVNKSNFQAEVGAELLNLKNELFDSIAKPPKASFVELLKTYKEFGLKPTRTEAEVLMRNAEGNLLGLRCLNKVFEETKAGYRVNIPDTSEFENDLKLLERLSTQEIMWSGTDEHTVLSELYTGTRKTINGTLSNYTWTGTELVIASAAFNSDLNKLEEMKARWSENILPKLEEYKEQEDPKKAFEADRARVADKGIEKVVEPAEVKEAKARNYSEIMDAYKGGAGIE